MRWESPCSWIRPKTNSHTLSALVTRTSKWGISHYSSPFLQVSPKSNYMINFKINFLFNTFSWLCLPSFGRRNCPIRYGSCGISAVFSCKFDRMFYLWSDLSFKHYFSHLNWMKQPIQVLLKGTEDLMAWKMKYQRTNPCTLCIR